MARQQIDFTYDANLQLKDAGLVAASAAATVNSVAKVLPLGAGRFDGRVILDTTAIDLGAGDALYTIVVGLSSSPTFAAGNVNATAVLVGHSSKTLESASSALGRRECAFTNEINGILYPYVRIYTIVAGTITTGINFTAFVAENKP